MLAALARKSWDLVLAKHPMPQFGSLGALAILKEQGLDTPLIVFCDQQDEAAASETIQAGARDFLGGPGLDRLAAVVARELGVLEASRKRQQFAASFRAIETVVQNSPEAIFLISERGTVGFANPAAEAIFGYGINEILGQPFIMLMPERLRQSQFDQIRRADTGTACIYELVGLHRSGREIPLEFSCSGMGQGPNSFLVEIVRDISERKAAENALRASESRYRTMFESAQDAVFLVQGDVFSDCNSAALRMFGCRREDLIGQSPMRFSPALQPDGKDSADKVRRVIEGAVAGQPQRFEWRHCRLDGSEFETEVSLNRIDTNGNPMLLAIVRDITERKRTEEAIWQSRQMLQLVLDTIPVRVFWKDRNLHFLGANRAFAGDAGLKSPQELIGKDDFQMIWRDNAQLYRHDDQEIIDTGLAKLNYEEPQTSLDGKNLWLQTSKIPLRDIAGSIQGVLGVYEDITERKRAQEELRLDESRLEGLLKLGEMADAPLSEITDFAMEEGVRLTKSTIGYVAFLNKEQTVLEMRSWSREAMDECIIEDKPLIYPVETTGLWGEAVRQRRPVITNDYQGPSPLKRGYPQGHIQITRHMNVPVFDGDKIVVVAGVGNKEAPYDESDVRQLQLLMAGMWRLVQRKESQEAMRESEERIRSIASNIPGLIYQFYARDNGEMGLYYVSERSQDVLGLSNDPRDFFDRFVACFSPREKERLLASVQQAIGSASRWEFEGTFVRPTGEEIFLRGTAKPRRVENELIFDGVLLDVTARKAAEDALRQSRERLQFALEGGELGMWDWYIQTGTVVYNDHWCRMLQYRPDEVPPNLDFFKDQLHPDDREKVFGRLQEHVEGRLPMYESEHRLRTKSGGWRWVLDRGKVVEWDKDGRAVRATGVVVDITDRVLAVESLRQSEQKVQALIENAPFGAHVYELKSDGQLIFVGYNPAADRILGVRHSPLLGKPIEEAFPSLVGTPIPDMYRNVAATGQRYEDEKVVYEDQKISGAFEILAFGTGLNRMAVFFRDITERKQAQEDLLALQASLEEQVTQRTAEAELRARQLRILAGRLRQAEQKERRRIANILHEHFQQLLCGAQFQLSRLRRGLVDPELIGTADEIRQILDTGIETSRSLAVELRPPVLYELGLAPALKWLAERMKEKHGLTVEATIDPTAEPAQDDIRIMLFESASELLFNTVKHAHVSVARLRLSRTAQGQMEIMVSDEGQGFDLARLPDVRNLGSLGLFGIREQIEAAGGDLSIETAPGRGTRVWVRVPDEQNSDLHTSGSVSRHPGHEPGNLDGHAR